MKIEINSIRWLAWLWLVFWMNVAVFITFVICLFLSRTYIYFVAGVWDLPLTVETLKYILRKSIPGGIIGGTAGWIVAKKGEIDNKRKAKEEQEKALESSEEPSDENSEDFDNSKTN